MFIGHFPKKGEVFLDIEAMFGDVYKERLLVIELVLSTQS